MSHSMNSHKEDVSRLLCSAASGLSPTCTISFDNKISPYKAIQNNTIQPDNAYKHNGAQIDDAANADAMTPMPFKVSLSTATVLEPQWPVTLLMHGVWRTNHIDGPLGAKITKPAQILLIASESKRLPGKYYDSSALFKLRKMESIKGISVNCVSK